MKKKIWIILGVSLGVIGVGGAVGYFFFWEDIQLLFGGSPKGVAAVKEGDVDLVGEFSESSSPGGSSASRSPSASPADAGGESAEGEDLSTPPDMEESPEQTASAGSAATAEDEGGSAEETDLGEEGTDEITAAPPAPAPATAKPAPPIPKSEPVPTLSRKPVKPAPPPPPVSVEEEEEEEVPAPKPSKPAPVTARSEPPPKRSPARPVAPPSPEAAASNAIQKKAQGLIQKKKYADAEIALRQYLSTNGWDGDVHFMLGFLYIQQNKKGLAIPHFQKAAADSKDPQIRQMADQYLRKLRP